MSARVEVGTWLASGSRECVSQLQFPANGRYNLFQYRFVDLTFYLMKLISPQTTISCFYV